MSDNASNNNLSKPNKKGLFLSIRSKILIYFGSIFTITLTLFVLSEMFGIPFTNFKGEYERHQSDVFRNLNLVADLKKERLKHWVEERRGDARVLSESTMIRSHVVSLLPLVDENIVNGFEGNELQIELQKEISYQNLTQYLNLVCTTYGLYDKIQIANLLNGTVVASTRAQESGMNISQSDSFSRIIHQGYDEVIDIGKDPSSGILKLFILRAIYSHEGEARAVLIMHINPDDFIKRTLHTGGGLGQTGEALLIDQDVKIITTLKYPLEDGTAAIPFEYQIKARPAVFASQGQEGIIATEDYRGEAVLAAYRHIRLTSELGWGLVVKRDQAEIFAPLRESIFYRIFVGSLCAFVMLGVIIFTSRNLTRSIRRLSKTARDVEEGNLDVRASIKTSDEVGLLASAFDSMLNHVQDWNTALNKQVKARTVELESKNAELERYTYTVSHDLKSPLVTIKGFLGLLEADMIKGDAERIKKDVGHIHNAADKMNQLLDELLELSRVGEVAGVKEKVPFEYLANEVLELDGGRMKKLGIEVKIAPDLPIMYVDRLRLVEVLQNFIDNAVKHMGRQSEPCIEIGARQVNGEDVYYVRDNGIGIEPRYHENVFGLFNKLDKASDGTGVGLAIVRRIIEVHGGRVWVESKGKEKGSTFCFTIAKNGGGT